MKKSKKIGYLLREGFRDLAKHGFMSFAAVCVMVACMVIIGSFVLICYNIQAIISDLERDNQLTVFIEETYSTAEAQHVGTDISRIENVAEKTFTTRQEAFEHYVASHDDPSAFAGITADTFRDRYYITLEDNSKLEATISQLEAVEGVADVQYVERVFQMFSMLQRIVTLASIAITAVLLIVSLLIIANTIKLAMYDRREQIGIMKMVGATNRFIRFPFVVQGMVLGFLGGGIAFGLEWELYNLIAEKIMDINMLNLFALVPFTQVILPMAIAFGVTGLLVGVVGSLLSIRKFLDV